MKRLLLPLLTSIVLLTFAGDLGPADYKYDSKWTRDKERRTELLNSGGTYSVRFGHSIKLRGNKIYKSRNSHMKKIPHAFY